MRPNSLLLAALALFLTLGILPGQDSKPAEPPASGQAKVQVKHPARVRLGGFFLGAGFHRFRCYSPFYPCGYFPRYYYGLDPYYHLPYGLITRSQLAPAEPEGRLQLNVNPPSAEVFIEGAFAGLARDLKKIRLPAGAYTLKFSAEGFTPLEQRVYVLTTRQLKLNIDLSPQTGAQP